MIYVDGNEWWLVEENGDSWKLDEWGYPKEMDNPSPRAKATYRVDGNTFIPIQE